MRALILDGLFADPGINQVFYDQKSSLQNIIQKAQEHKFERLILIQNGNIKLIPQGIKNVIIEQPNLFQVLKTIHKEAKNCTDIVLMNAGQPFFDSAFLDRMLLRHDKFLADYTYALGYPDGLTFQIVKKEALLEMAGLVENEKTMEKNYLFQSLSKDINSFDLETFLAPYDVRILRVSLGANDAGEIKMTNKIVSQLGLQASFDAINRFCYENPHQLYTVPYLVTFEITNEQNSQPIYFPADERPRSSLSITQIRNLADQIRVVNDQVNVRLGGLGEPALHADFFEILDFLGSRFNSVIVESNARLIDENWLDKIKPVLKTKVKFVIRLDALSASTYQKIHRQADYQRVLQAMALLEKNGFTVYQQIVRLSINEEEIEQIIRSKKVDNLILRKFSTFCGQLPDLKVVDLAPLERIPCYHLRRELFISSDCKASYCAYAYSRAAADLQEQSIAEALLKLEAAFVKNAQKDYFDFCEKCDDYYLFHF